MDTLPITFAPSHYSMLANYYVTTPPAIALCTLRPILFSHPLLSSPYPSFQFSIECLCSQMLHLRGKQPTHYEKSEKIK